MTTRAELAFKALDKDNSGYITGGPHMFTNKYSREGKGHRCWLGDLLECTNHLAARMI